MNNIYNTISDLMKKNNYFIIEDIIKKKKKLNYNMRYLDDKKTLAHYAVENCRGWLIKFLIEKKADINIQDYYGLAPLHLACIYGDIYMVKLLLQHGADINLKDNNGNTPLYYAILSNNLLLVNTLLNNENISFDKDYSLHKACEKKLLSIVKTLLVNKYNVNCQTQNGTAPLHVACAYHNNLPIVELLLDYGADINIKDKYNNTPLHIAVEDTEDEQLQIFLLEKGADPNIQNNWGKTPLYIACFKQKIKIAEEMIKKDGDINISCLLQKKPLDYIQDKNSRNKLEKLYNLTKIMKRSETATPSQLFIDAMEI